MKDKGLGLGAAPLVVEKGEGGGIDSAIRSYGRYQGDGAWHLQGRTQGQ